MSKYFYRVYGENVESDFEMPELYTIEPTKDITMRVCLEDIPKEILDKFQDKKGLVYSKRSIVFYIPRVGYYYLDNGNKIRIQCDKDCDINDRKIFTLGSAMGMSLILKGKLPIHGGTVTQNGKALIVTGDSGAGKSTISTGLRLDGMGFLADDVSALQKNEDGVWIVQPAYPQQKLCRDAAIHFGYDLDKLIYIDEDRDKFAIRLDEGFNTEGLPLGAIVELQVGNEDQKEDVLVKEVTGHEKLFTFKHNIYRGFTFDLIGMKPESLKMCLEIISNVPIYRVIRKPGVQTEKKIIELIRGFDALK